jgi:hypothetical protein
VDVPLGPTIGRLFTATGGIDPMHSMTDDLRWYVVNGNEWRLRSGDINAVIWLDDDEITYLALIRRPDRQSRSLGEFYSIKEAKTACLGVVKKKQERIAGFLADQVIMGGGEDDTA